MKRKPNCVTEKRTHCITEMGLAFEHALHEMRLSGKSEAARERLHERADEVREALHEAESYHHYVEFITKASCAALGAEVPLFEVMCQAINYGVELGLVAARILDVEEEEVLQ